MEIYKHNDEKFKGVNISFVFTCDVNDNRLFSLNSVLGSLLAKSSKKYSNQKEIEKYLASLYGASYHVNVDKIGDLYSMEFAFEYINREFLPQNEELLDKMLDFIYEVIYNPADWSKDSIEREKEYILERINEKKDDKLRYGILRMEELMCMGEPYGSFLYGDTETVEKIDKKQLLMAYDNLKASPLCVFISGNLKGYDDIDKRIEDRFKTYASKGSVLSLNVNKSVDKKGKCEELKETFDTTQSVVVMGYRAKESLKDKVYALNVYNAILGATPSSKLFQNVREKESLCYTVRSKGYRAKNMMIIYAGIDGKNYKKAVATISKQVDDMKKGNISDIEFNSAKDSIIADLKQVNDIKCGTMKLLYTNLVIDKDSNTTVEDIISKIESVTIEEVVEVANMMTLEKVLLIGGKEDV